jgi:hypothetical protein
MYQSQKKGEETKSYAQSFGKNIKNKHEPTSAQRIK